MPVVPANLPRMHLFIVSERTLPVHLEYQFAGITKGSDCSWSNVTITGGAERPQAGMYADICRVHQGDEVLFYLETPAHDLGREGGRFLGVFEVLTESPFYEPGGQYLWDELNVTLPQGAHPTRLIYRHLIQPKEIFAEGVTEWQAMDEMSDFGSVHDIPWTLIYRKMTGGRGCTPLLPHEARNLRRALDLRNAGQRLPAGSVGYDSPTVSLAANGVTSPYAGNTSRIENIEDRLKHLISNTDRKWEPHLQAYLMQEIERNASLTQALFPGVEITWVGNEIYAGAGMQSIDILVYSRNDLNSFIHLIELKCDVAREDAAAQLNRYVKWLKAHIPDVSVHQIVPTLIAPGADAAFHEHLKTFLRGHGITQYRVVQVDGNLNFAQQIYRGF